jgi:dihydrofolate synthase / folylpolyglutamate synthase
VAGRTLDEWLAFQQALHPRVMDFTLERMRVMIERLALAPGRARVVTVGGTNGKGSVTATLEALGAHAGLAVGLYTSPHLERYTERIRLRRREIDEPTLTAVFERIEAVRGDVALTYFEYGTLAALLAFADAKLDLWILEVGLGGRLDAVNALDADASVVVSVSLDHCEYLGDTLEAIGREKAGIFRAGRPAILGDRSLTPAVRAAALSTGAEPWQLGVEFDSVRHGDRHDYRGRAARRDDLPAPRLAGQAQYGNTATALAALESIGLLPDRDAVAAALLDVQLVGRYQVMPGPVEWVFDVAHNEGSAAVLSSTLVERRGAGRTLVVAGVLADKDAVAIGRHLATALRTGDHVVTVTLEGERGRGAEALRAVWAPLLPTSIECAESVVHGCERAAAQARPGDRVVVFGSFHSVAPALAWHRLYSDRIEG